MHSFTPSDYNGLRFALQSNQAIANPATAQVQSLQTAMTNLRELSHSNRTPNATFLAGDSVRTSPFYTAAANKGPATPAPAPKLDNFKDTFQIHYKDEKGGEKKWTFSLLPAIENTLRPGAGNSTAGVPEVKPGILVRTGMNYKRFLIPGGPPVFQALGIEETFYQLVGAFVGAETNDGTEVSGQAVYDIKRRLNAYERAMTFDKEVVQAAREVKLIILAGAGKKGSPIIDTPVHVEFHGIVQNIRYFATRHDRVYYAIDVRVTRYPWTPTAEGKPKTRPTEGTYREEDMDRQPPPMGPVDTRGRPPEVWDYDPRPESPNYQQPAAPPPSNWRR